MLGIIASSKLSAFSPLSITGCQVWLDAADTTQISLSGSAVTQWNDKSTNAYTFTQGTSANRPASGTATQNSKNIIVFDGVNDRLASTVAASVWKFLHFDQTTIFWAAKHITSAGIDILGTNGDTSGNVGFAIGFEAGTIGINNTIGTGGVRTYVNITGSVITSNAYYYGTHLSDPSNATAADRSDIRFKQGSAIKNNIATATKSSSNPISTLTIGDAITTGAAPFSGSIGEIIIYTGLLSAGDILLVQQYLSAKWGV